MAKRGLNQGKKEHTDRETILEIIKRLSEMDIQADVVITPYPKMVESMIQMVKDDVQKGRV